MRLAVFKVSEQIVPGVRKEQGSPVHQSTAEILVEPAPEAGAE